MDENMTHTHARRSYGAASGRDTVSDPSPRDYHTLLSHALSHALFLLSGRSVIYT